MTPAQQYRVKAGDLISLARAESDIFRKAELEKLAQAFLRLAEQADRNSRTDVIYEPPPGRPAMQQQQQPQVQTDDDPKA
jgi:hypothetical protein